MSGSQGRHHGYFSEGDKIISRVVLGTGTRVPESPPATRVLAGYPGTRVCHITRKMNNSNTSSARVQMQLLIAFVIMDSDGVRSLTICTYSISLIFIYLFMARFQCNDSNEDETQSQSEAVYCMLTCWSSCLKNMSSLENTKLTQAT